MDIKLALEREHSKRNTEAIVNYIGDNPKLFAELMATFNTPNYRLTQRAAWPISYIAEHAPQLLNPYWDEIFVNLQKDIHPAFKRNIFRALYRMKTIPEEIHGEVVEHCMQAIADAKNPAAIRAFAMHIMGKMAKIYPDLSGELMALVEPLTAHDLPSIKSSSKKILKQLSTLI
jgi:hypothetical protein